MKKLLGSVLAVLTMVLVIKVTGCVDYIKITTNDLLASSGFTSECGFEVNNIFDLLNAETYTNAISQQLDSMQESVQESMTIAE